MKGDTVMTRTNEKSRKNMSFKEKIEKYFTDNAFYFLSAACAMSGSIHSMNMLDVLKNDRM